MQVKSSERPTVQLLVMTDIDNHSGLASSAVSTFSHHLLAKEITYSNRKLNLKLLERSKASEIKQVNYNITNSLWSVDTVGRLTLNTATVALRQDKTTLTASRVSPEC